MKNYTNEMLIKAAAAAKARASVIVKKNYRYARSLGFCARESTALQFKNEEIIKKLADERKKKEC